MDWWIVVVTLGQLTFVGWIIWVGTQYKINRLRLHSEQRFRLLERFNSAQEVSEFLETDTGSKFLEALAVRSAHPSHPLRGLVVTIIIGIILIFAGFAFLLLAWLNIFGDSESFLIPGVLGTLTGTGVVIAAAIAVRLFKRWDLPSADARLVESP